MKERIYTIPVTEAFRIECECPMCIMETKLEEEGIEYALGPSMMEPDGRIDSNKSGFCTKHFEKLYNSQKNRLALSLVLDTHLVEQNTILNNLYNSKKARLQKDSDLTIVKNISNKIQSKKTETQKLLDSLIDNLNILENSCTICKKINYTMGKFTEVILYLWFKEEDFKNLFNNKKGFCLKHFKMLLEGTKEHLNARQQAIFIDNIMKLQLENLGRIQKEVNWFAKKFDYRFNDAPWGNSKDSVPRSIKKITGPCDLR